jgi:GT2 family glycosyltransferase
VVCTHERPAPLEQLLRSIAEQQFPVDRIVVVDASRDRATEEMLERFGLVDGLASSCLYFRMTDPMRGLTRQRNFGTDWIRSDLVAFFDDDVVLQPGCLAALEAAHRCDRDVVGTGAVATNLLCRPWLLWRIRAALRLVPDLHPGTYHRSGMSVPWSFLDPSTELLDGDWLSGCAMMWRTAVVRSERFNETFGAYGGEDTEFSLRAARHGVLRMVGAARVLHLRVSAGRPDPFQVGEMTIWNKYRMHRDCLEDRRRRDVAWFAYAWTVDTLLLLRYLVRPRAWRDRSAEFAGRVRAARQIVTSSRLRAGGATSSGQAA